MYATYIFLPVPPFFVIKVRYAQKMHALTTKMHVHLFYQKKCHFYSFFDTKSIFLLFLSTFVIKVCVSNVGLASLHDKNACILFLIKKSIHAFFLFFWCMKVCIRQAEELSMGWLQLVGSLKS